MENKYKFGDVVLLTEGPHAGSKGVITGIPVYGVRDQYVVSTDDWVYGEFVYESDMTPIFNDDTNLSEELIKERHESLPFIASLGQSIDPYEYLMEMPIVNSEYTRKRKCPFEVYVEFEEGPIPHVHLLFNGPKSKKADRACLFM